MKKTILVFGAGSGLGAGILNKINNSIANENKLNFDIFGFSRRGRLYENSFNNFENNQFDLSLESNYTHFQKCFESYHQNLTSDKENNHRELIVYFAQGDGLFNSIENISDSELKNHFQLNLFSIFKLLKILYANISNYRLVTLIFISSTASKVGFADSTAYCASKHAISGLAKAIREEWKEKGVKVVNAYLGAVDTPIWNNRPYFNKNDMISLDDVSEFLASLTNIPQTLYLDEIHLTPRKGIL
ncbi:MAG: SDR family NAD(P)-dependent oxidoreductase [Leptospira sp.]|nr:SDR family NAD(P)-dependent oxidoreductase [Leptospira sp.]